MYIDYTIHKKLIHLPSYRGTKIMTNASNVHVSSVSASLVFLYIVDRINKCCSAVCMLGRL